MAIGQNPPSQFDKSTLAGTGIQENRFAKGGIARVTAKSEILAQKCRFQLGFRDLVQHFGPAGN